jgi:hypothetical protein
MLQKAHESFAALCNAHLITASHMQSEYGLSPDGNQGAEQALEGSQPLEHE